MKRELKGIKSITFTQADLKEIIRDVNQTQQPFFVYDNHLNQAVIISREEYTSLLNKVAVMEERLALNEIEDALASNYPDARQEKRRSKHSVYDYITTDDLFE